MEHFIPRHFPFFIIIDINFLIFDIVQNNRNMGVNINIEYRVFYIHFYTHNHVITDVQLLSNMSQVHVDFTAQTRSASQLLLFGVEDEDLEIRRQLILSVESFTEVDL